MARHVSGDRNPNAKLTWPEVRLIRTYYDEGMDRHQLAEEFDVHVTNIDCIVKRKSWNG